MIHPGIDGLICGTASSKLKRRVAKIVLLPDCAAGEEEAPSEAVTDT